MTNEEQQKTFAAICNNIRDDMLRESHKWPAHWQGQELQQLAYIAFANGRTPLMMSDQLRRNEFEREALQHNVAWRVWPGT